MWCSLTRKRQLLFWLAWRLQGTSTASDGRLCQVFVDSERAASALSKLARKTGRLQQARICAHTSTQTRRRAGRQHNMQQRHSPWLAQTRALLPSSEKVNPKTRLSVNLPCIRHVLEHNNGRGLLALLTAGSNANLKTVSYSCYGFRIDLVRVFPHTRP